MSAIFVKQASGSLSRVKAMPYEAEEVLQRMLADYPDLLSGDAGGDNARWLLIKREIGVASDADSAPRWSLDHLFLDRDGIPTLVEVKRSSDTRIRREVVGQMLDYAANGAAVWSGESIRASFEASNEDPDAALERFLEGAVGPEKFWETVSLNLKAGRLRLVFVADSIPPELRRIIEFLNEQMSETEVIGIEITRYRQENGDLETLVSNVIGQTESARRTKAGGSARSTASLEDLKRAITEEHGPALAARAMEFHRLLIDAGATVTMGSSSWPSANYWLARGTPTPVSLSMYVNGIAINFEYVAQYRSEEEMRRLLSLASEIPGIESYLEPLRDGTWNRRPTVPLAGFLPSDDSPRRVVALMVNASGAKRPLANEASG